MRFKLPSGNLFNKLLIGDEMNENEKTIIDRSDSEGQFETVAKRKTIYTDHKKTLDQKTKITFKSFVRHTWEMSQTNLHFIDFKTLYEEQLKKMFKPVNIEKWNNFSA